MPTGLQSRRRGGGSWWRRENRGRERRGGCIDGKYDDSMMAMEAGERRVREEEIFIDGNYGNLAATKMGEQREMEEGEIYGKLL